MVKQYSFFRLFLILIISFLFITIFTGCNSAKTSKTYNKSFTRKTGVPQPSITHGDPYVLNDALKLNQLDKRPIQISPFHIPPRSLDYATINKIEGKVLLLLVIDEKGDVIYVETKEPVSGLNEPAVGGALQLKFKPGEVNGRPVKAALYFPFIMKTVVPKSTITHGDPSVLNEAYTFNQLDKRPIQIVPFIAPPMTPLDYAIKNKIEGKVLLLLVIDEKGDIIYVETKKPVLGLNEPAVEGALQLKFEPGEVNGKPVKVRVMLPWSFTQS